MALPRMRTVLQCYKYFKQQDPETSISEYYLRRLIKSGEIPIFNTGTKVLINLDKLIEYLNSELEEDQQELEGYGKIRRIDG